MGFFQCREFDDSVYGTYEIYLSFSMHRRVLFVEVNTPR